MRSRSPTGFPLSQLLVVALILIVIVVVVFLKLKRLAERRTEAIIDDRVSKLKRGSGAWFLYVAYVIVGAAVLGALMGAAGGYWLFGGLAGGSRLGGAIIGAVLGIVINVPRELRHMLRRQPTSGDVASGFPESIADDRARPNEKPITIPADQRLDIVSLTARAATHASKTIRGMRHSPDIALRIVQAQSGDEKFEIQSDLPELDSDDRATESRGFLVLFNTAIADMLETTVVDFADGDFTFERSSSAT
jgi:Fe-S cluster assembly iron-binding protein IscA